MGEQIVPGFFGARSLDFIFCKIYTLNRNELSLLIAHKTKASADLFRKLITCVFSLLRWIWPCRTSHKNHPHVNVFVDRLHESVRA